jgi:hypothetical protein
MRFIAVADDTVRYVSRAIALDENYTLMRFSIPLPIVACHFNGEKISLKSIFYIYLSGLMCEKCDFTSHPKVILRFFVSATVTVVIWA